MGQLSFSDVKGAQLFSYFIVETFFLISIYYPDVFFNWAFAKLHHDTCSPIILIINYYFL